MPTYYGVTVSEIEARSGRGEGERFKAPVLCDICRGIALSCRNLIISDVVFGCLGCSLQAAVWGSLGALSLTVGDHPGQSSQPPPRTSTSTGACPCPHAASVVLSTESRSSSICSQVQSLLAQRRHQPRCLLLGDRR